MSAVAILPGASIAAGTALAASRSVVLHLGEPDLETSAAFLASDEVEAFAASAAAPHDVAAVRSDGARLELWCRGDVCVAAGDMVITGADEMHHHVTELAPAAKIDVTMWIGDATDRPDSCAVTAYRVCVGAVPATACSMTITADAVPVDPIDELFGPTIARDVEAAAVRDDASVGAPAALAVMVFSSGERVVIDRTTVIGRRPTERAHPAAQPDGHQRLVALACPSVSRQHAIVRLDRWCATIEDLGSANGTTVAHGDEPPTALHRATPADLMVGSRVVLGGDASFVVEAIA